MESTPIILRSWFELALWIHDIGGPFFYDIHLILGILYSFIVITMQFIWPPALVIGIVKLINKIRKKV